MIHSRLFFLFVNLLFFVMFSGIIVADETESPTEPPSENQPESEKPPEKGWLTSINSFFTEKFQTLQNSLYGIFNPVKDFVYKKYDGARTWVIKRYDESMKIISKANQKVQDGINWVYELFTKCRDYLYSLYTDTLDWFKRQVAFIVECFFALYDHIKNSVETFVTWINDFFTNLWYKFLDLLRFCWRFCMFNLTRFLDFVVHQVREVWRFMLSFLPEVDTGGVFVVGLGYFVSFGLILDDFIPIHEAFMLFGLAVAFRVGIVVFRFLTWVILEVIP